MTGAEPRTGAPATGLLPASPWQARFRLEQQLAPQSDAYNASFLFEGAAALDLSRLRRALDAVCARQVHLRARFIVEGSEVHARLEPPRCPWIDAASSEALLAAVHHAPFDLEREPPIRAGVAGDRFALSVHHVVLEGPCVPELFAAIGAAYVDPDRPPAPAPWPAFASTDASAARSHWAAALASVDRFDVTVPPCGGAGEPLTVPVTFALPDDLERRGREVARSRGATWFELCAAAWMALLHRYTGQSEIPLTYPVSLRPEELAGVIGCWVNTLPLVGHLGPQTPFEELLAGVSKQQRAARPHRHLPWIEIVRMLREDGRLRAGAPGFNIGFAQTNLSEDLLDLGGVQLRPLPRPVTRAPYDLLLEYQPGDRFRLTGRGDLYGVRFLEPMAAAYVALLRAVIDQPSMPVGAVALADRLPTPAPRWTAFPRRTLVEQFEEQVRAHPGATAVVHRGERLTYQALLEQASELAGAVSESIGRPLEPGEAVGLVCTPGIAPVRGMIAVGLLGGAYVPFRAEDPPQRIRALVDEAACVAVIGAELDGLPCVRLDATGRAQAPTRAPGAADTAAVLFTSGSTGRPKGVQVTHQSLQRLSHGACPVAAARDDVLLQAASLAFDMASAEIWMALLVGATVVVADRDVTLDPTALRALVQAEGVTFVWMTTAWFHQHATAHPSLFDGLRCLLVGGEVLDAAVMNRVLTRPDRPRHVYNVYGPTENGVLTTTHALPGLLDPRTPVPIGVPLPDTSVYVLDDHLQPLPEGAVGTLWTGGFGLANGYRNQAELSAQRFPQNPYASADDRAAGRNATIYDTGDRVRWAEGSLHYAGRSDGQTKIRGYRLELGEIERALRAQPGVDDCAVIARDGELCAHWVGAGRAPHDLEDALAAVLPDYMVPRRWAQIDALPRTPNGKVDRRALANREALAAEAPLAAAETPVEAALLPVWQAAFERPLGVTSNFFALGGDSLRAIALVASMNEATGSAVSVEQLFRNPTIRALAAATQVPDAAPAGLRRSGRPPAPVVALTEGQRGHWILALLGGVYWSRLVLRVGEPLDHGRLERAWNEVLQRYETFWLSVERWRPRLRRTDPIPVTLVEERLAGSDARTCVAAIYAALHDEAPQRWRDRRPMGSLRWFTSPAGQWLAISMPHLLVDGQALTVIVEALKQAYLTPESPDSLAEPPAPSLDDYREWEAGIVTPNFIRDGWAHYARTLRGDATWTLPRATLTPAVHAAVHPVDDATIERLRAIARANSVTLESLLVAAAFFTVHLATGRRLVRCLSTYSNRDAPGLARFPHLLANLTFTQSTFDEREPFARFAAALIERYVAAFRFGRLPAALFFAMSRRLFFEGELRHTRLGAWAGRLAGAVSGASPERVAAMVDLVLANARFGLDRAWDELRGSAEVRTTGCLINITTSLSEVPPMARPPLPLTWERGPLDVPQSVPGCPVLELYRDGSGVKVFFQARFTPPVVERWAALFCAVAAEAATDWEASAGELAERVRLRVPVPWDRDELR